jgi:hypothetical protein
MNKAIFYSSTCKINRLGFVEFVVVSTSIKRTKQSRKKLEKDTGRPNTYKEATKTEYKLFRKYLQFFW